MIVLFQSFQVPRWAVSKLTSIYDLITGIESLAKIDIVLDFFKKKVTLDHVTIPMRPHNQFLDPKVLQAQFLTAL